MIPIDQEIKRKQLKYKKGSVVYYIAENKGIQTILMLHPAFADHEIFQLQMDYFKNHYQVIILDMPGHGESQSKGSNVALKDMPAIINQILSDNNITSCHVIGVSLGSLVAQAFADRYPALVRSVTIVGGYSIHKANENVLKAQKKEGMRWIFYILFSMKKFRNYVISVSCHTEHCRELFARGIQRFHRRSFAAMAGMQSFFNPKATPMTYPLLIVTGEHDLRLAQDAAIAMHELEVNSRLIKLPNAGHCANVDNPSEFNVAVDSFISSL